jgi:hypothetical protein
MKSGWMALVGAVALGGTVGLLLPAPSRDAEATVAKLASTDEVCRQTKPETCPTPKAL